MTMLEELKLKISQISYVVAVFMNQSKPFETINHNLLAAKLDTNSVNYSLHYLTL